MQNSKFVVLDIGSGRLRLSELELEDDNIEMINYSECEYAGFQDGSFIDNDLQQACEKLVEDINVEEVDSIFVGVPSEFCGQVVKEITSTFDAPVDLSGHTRDEFLRYAESDELVAKIDGGLVINVDIIELNTHENAKGDLGSANVSGKVSYIYADKKLLNDLANCLAKLGFRDIEFTSAVNAQVNQMLDDNAKRVGTVFIDVGFITTSVAVARGGAIESLRSFSLGGAFISADLSEGLGIPYKLADCLKKKVLLTVDPSEVDYYVVNYNGQDYEFQASKVNKIVKAKIDHIAVMIAKCIDEKQYSYNFVVTGGGLAGIKGAIDTLSTPLGVVAKEVAVKFGELNKPEQSAIVSLIYEASDKVREARNNLPFWQNLWEKVKNFFRI